MLIGVPKETKINEKRVGLTPAGVDALVQNGHQVRVETGAGVGSGFADDDYAKAGATIVPHAQEAWQADLVIKVKEPLAEEYRYFRENLILFTFLHLAAEPGLTRALVENKVTAIAYETIQLDSGALPLLTPMSETAGRLAIQIGAHYLENVHGGKGVLLGGLPGVLPAEVVIIGGGIVGKNAARMALGAGANVTILDINPERLRQLDDLFAGRVKTLISNSYHIAEAVKKADLLVGAVLVPGARAPKLVTEQMVRSMQPGSVIVDVAIDQGGSIETIDKGTTLANPTFEKYGVIHYAVTNIPGSVARTSTIALNNVTLPYALLLANKGCETAALENLPLRKGINTMRGHVTYKAVAEAHAMAYVSVESLLDV
jgi:alanine dehydrogenase